MSRLPKPVSCTNNFQVSEIPKCKVVPKPLVPLKSAASTLNLNAKLDSGPGNKNDRRAALSRRSKTVAEIRPMRTFSNRPGPSTRPTAPVTTFKRPMKRPGETLKENSATIVKISKPAAIAEKSSRPKPAPYDYKGRFNLLKEQNDKLKATYRELKEKHDETVDENENLMTENKQFHDQLNVVQTELVAIKTELVQTNGRFIVTEQENAELKNNLETLSGKFTKCETALLKSEENLKQVTVEQENLLQQFQKKSEDFQNVQRDLEECTSLIKTLKNQLFELETDKRRMHNDIQEMKGNIRVFCRIRPQLETEKYKFLNHINCVDERTIEMQKNKENLDSAGRQKATKCEFSFDRVFGPESTQHEIFEELSQLVQSALDGYNVCIFAYGQTGSGKTYTMEGGHSSISLGMIPRAVDLIFSSFGRMEPLGWRYTVRASFLEIYNETIVDLLNPRASNHDIRMADAKGTDVYVTNLTTHEISCADELKKFLHVAQQNRAVAATENNERSSRSHSVAKISLEGINVERNEKITAALNLIDLAGSERVHAAERLKETQNINKSLANLGNVILALVNKQDHVPYRNSKLTHLLMPCLGGNSKTLMMVNISPLEQCYGESVNSLRFASNVNQCKTGAIRKNKTVSATFS